MRPIWMLIAVLAMPAAAAAPMPRWAAVGTGAGGGAIEIDRASLTWRAQQRVWWRIRYVPAKRDGTVEERHLELIDCRSGESAVIETVSLNGAGQVIANQRDGEELAMQRINPPTPGTTGETVVEGACRLRPPPPPPPRKRR
ncbi:hypothetical protein GON01_13560 [Sphingomonas sp. MAH-20]|uniref:Surface-adhesin protein E-like domain-containing protein n=1 Tax=Sphingomonas horti TaxID=2682842 RepID=A0A6I4J3R0_9SPHN|nr:MULTISPECIES: surface-adhesin E family protein [Sphingomonas]MBA2918924.1 hypothetical protein [Sphingomonas sp. CGMCC 1.13658]MVO78957.1 hypothetical protein [Sphingomonas horti]